MAARGNWTIIFDDKKIIKNYAEGADQGIGYIIDDNTFWSNNAFQNIWAIQSGTDNSSDEVEHRDGTPHNSLSDEGVDIQQFVTRWDAAHLAQLQSNWDNDNVDGETESEKITRLGARPTSYSSS
jgi:hypothetical protein